MSILAPIQVALATRRVLKPGLVLFPVYHHFQEIQWTWWLRELPYTSLLHGHGSDS